MKLIMLINVKMPTIVAPSGLINCVCYEFSSISIATFCYNIADKQYDKCSKMFNTFLFLFSIKMMVIRAGITNLLAR